jgi:hypothetical protein
VRSFKDIDEELCADCVSSLLSCPTSQLSLGLDQLSSCQTYLYWSPIPTTWIEPGRCSHSGLATSDMGMMAWLLWHELFLWRQERDVVTYVCAWKIA